MTCSDVSVIRTACSLAASPRAPLLHPFMPLPSSPLVLLFAFSFICLLIGTWLLTGGDVTSALLALHPSHSSPAQTASSNLPSFVLASSSSASSPSPSSSAPLSLQLWWQYQSAWSGPSSSPPFNSSSCYSSFPASSSVVFVLCNVDDPLADRHLSGDSGHQLLQWLAALHLSLTLSYSFLTSPIFPSRPHWDAFVGLGSGEKRVSQLQLELAAYQQQAVSQQTVERLVDSMPDMQAVKAAIAVHSPLVVTVGELQVTAVDAETVWLNDTRLLRLLQQKYCTARMYRPVPIDLYAAQRASRPTSVVERAAAERPSLFLPAAFIVAVHVECDHSCVVAGEQDRYVQQLAVNTTAVLRAVTQMYAAAVNEQLSSVTGSLHSAPPSPPPSSPLHLFVHLFADRSAIDGDDSSGANEASAAATRSLASQLSTAQPLDDTTPLPPHSIHMHIHVPSSWAMHHYITADAFVGNVKGSAAHDEHTAAHTAAAQRRAQPPTTLFCVSLLSPSLLSGMIRHPAASWLPSSAAPPTCIAGRSRLVVGWHDCWLCSPTADFSSRARLWTLSCCHCVQ